MQTKIMPKLPTILLTVHKQVKRKLHPSEHNLHKRNSLKAASVSSKQAKDWRKKLYIGSATCYLVHSITKILLRLRLVLSLFELKFTTSNPG